MKLSVPPPPLPLELTLTVALACAEPFTPVQLNAYAVVLVGETVALPLTAFDPVQPPEAVQAVAFVEAQVRVKLPPELILAGLADRLAVGAGVVTAVTVTVALTADEVPPAPLQLKE